MDELEVSEVGKGVGLHDSEFHGVSCEVPVEGGGDAMDVFWSEIEMEREAEEFVCEGSGDGEVAGLGAIGEGGVFVERGVIPAAGFDAVVSEGGDESLVDGVVGEASNEDGAGPEGAIVLEGDAIGESIGEDLGVFGGEGEALGLRLGPALEIGEGDGGVVFAEFGVGAGCGNHTGFADEAEV